LSDSKLRKLCHQLKFLVIDDFENFRTSVRLMLTSFGAAFVDSAANADQALNSAKFNSYDVILCDFNLGNGKNGQQILEELRLKKRLKRTHLFIMISADTSKESVLGTREYQPDAYIAKPVTRNTLEARLLQLLTQQAALKPINKEIDLGNSAKAISLCQQELERKSRYRSWCLQTLAELYLALGDNSSAQRIYSDILASRPVDWAKLGLGKVLYNTSQYREAKAAYNDVIKQSPYIVEAYEGVSETCLKLGQRKEAQTALQEAVSISPRMVTRQCKLAELCIENNDITGASQAYRQAVIYGENTVHENPSLYLNFGRCLSEVAAANKDQTGASLAEEADAAIEKIFIKFSYDEAACNNAMLVRARVHAGQGRLEKAKEILEEVESLLDTENIDVETGLELSRTFYSVGDLDKAEQILIDLSQRFEDNPDALAQIEALMDEPESLETRIKAKGYNKTGIQLFEQGNLDEAIAAFGSAVQLTPKHAALNLNLAQVALRKFQNKNDTETLEIAQQCLERIKHIPKQHKQYRRLQHIKNSLAKHPLEQ
jgi:tetratricopeptide (TPR) repeat protein